MHFEFNGDKLSITMVKVLDLNDLIEIVYLRPNNIDNLLIFAIYLAHHVDAYL